MASKSYRLDLQGYGIKSLPTKFVSVQEMTMFEQPRFNSINLSRNLLLVMPPSLAKVATLRDLSLDNNIIPSLPPLQPFFKLQYLSLCHNSLRSLPRSIGELVALETLNVAYNQIASLPEEMRLLRQLKYLGLEGNRELQTISLDLSRMTGTQIKIDGLLHIPGDLENPLLILEFIENLNLLGLPMNLRSHWRTAGQSCHTCKANWSALSKAHNCRICGYLSCANCCSTFLMIPCFNLGEGVRVCKSCQSAVEGRNFEQVPDPKAVVRPPKPSMALPEMVLLDERELTQAAESGHKTIRRMEQSLAATMLREAAAMEPADKMQLAAEAARLRQALSEVEVRYRALMSSLAHCSPSQNELAVSTTTSSASSPSSPRWKAAAAPTTRPASPHRGGNFRISANFTSPSLLRQPNPPSEISASPPPSVSPISVTSPRRNIRSMMANLPPPPVLPPVSVPPAPTRAPPSPRLREPQTPADRPPSLNTLLAALGEPTEQSELPARPPSDLLMLGRDTAANLTSRNTAATGPLPAGTLLQMRAKWTHKAADPRELRFKAGDVIVVLEKVGTEWYFGIANGRSGFFPATHVVPL